MPKDGGRSRPSPGLALTLQALTFTVPETHRASEASHLPSPHVHTPWPPWGEIPTTSRCQWCHPQEAHAQPARPPPARVPSSQCPGPGCTGRVSGRQWRDTALPTRKGDVCSILQKKTRDRHEGSPTAVTDSPSTLPLPSAPCPNPQGPHAQLPPHSPPAARTPCLPHWGPVRGSTAGRSPMSRTRGGCRFAPETRSHSEGTVLGKAAGQARAPGEPNGFSAEART